VVAATGARLQGLGLLGQNGDMSSKTPGRAYWDDYAADYAQHAEHSAFNALYDRPAVLGLLGDVADQRVLDVGCGPGLYAEELVRRGASVVGFDQSPEMVQLASSRLGEAAEFRVQDLGEPIGWADDASFDLAVMALVIHHIDDRVSALREICRVLRPRGRLVVSTHHPVADWRRQGGSYFDSEVVEETWSRGWQVRYWRQPLTRTCAEFAEAGFWIERLVEPLPAPEMALADPEHDAELRAEPGFIAFRLVKAPEEAPLPP
jgi:SAM-dependent methyltransferase